MAEIPDEAGQHRAGSQGPALAGNDLAEHPAQSHCHERQEEIEHSHGDQGPRTGHIAEAVQPHQHLQQAGGKGGEQAPFGAIAVGDDQNRSMLQAVTLPPKGMSTILIRLSTVANASMMALSVSRMDLLVCIEASSLLFPATNHAS